VRRMTSLARLGTTLLLLLCSSCGLLTLKDRYQRWHVEIVYQELNGTFSVAPDHLEVHGPRGEAEVFNYTGTERGFAIVNLGVFEKVKGNTERTVQLTDLENGKIYTFEDQLHPRSPRCHIGVRYPGHS